MNYFKDDVTIWNYCYFKSKKLWDSLSSKCKKGITRIDKYITKFNRLYLQSVDTRIL